MRSALTRCRHDCQVRMCHNIYIIRKFIKSGETDRIKLIPDWMREPFPSHGGSFTNIKNAVIF